MNKYYEMEGQFAENGRISENSKFTGFVEIEEEVYKIHNANLGEVNVQHFKGIHVDTNDASQRKCLILGALMTGKHRDVGHAMDFSKLTSDPRVPPIKYYTQKKEDGNYRGFWVTPTEYFGIQEFAQITKFKQLSNEQVKAMKVLEFLKTGYQETTELPFPASMVRSKYEQKKHEITTIRGKLKNPKPNVVKKALKKVQQQTEQGDGHELP